VILFAHGLVSRADLPIPEWLFGWAAAMVLVVSFVALAVLWPDPRLQEERWRALFGGRRLLTRPLEIVCGAIGVFLFGLVVYSGLEGTQSQTANFAPTFIYVIFWVGLVAVSVLFGDVFRAFNPWRALGRAVAWVAKTAARTDLPAPLEYPDRLGRWPSAAGIAAFTALELVSSSNDSPESLAIATLIYSALTFVAMALYGVEAWSDRGEAFSVYFNLFSRISIFETRDGVLGVRRLLSGLPRLLELPGTVALLCVMIGSTTFDGAAEAEPWTSISPKLTEFFTNSIGLSPQHALETTFAIGYAAAVALVASFYWLGCVGARSVGGGFTTGQLARGFCHSLVPIAFAYVAAHYLTFLVFNGQSIVFLASDPLGDGSDLFGTAGNQIDYTVLGSTATWYLQVGFVVAGHVAALTLAHDRALALYDQARLAVRSQYWMLAVMVGFTSLALFLLSQSNV
jgi:hypothetical protein